MTDIDRDRLGWCSGLAALLVCALAATRVLAEPPPPAPPPDASEEAKIEAAKRHPVAHPEPRPLYPAQQPPPREQRGLPAQAPAPREPRAPLPAAQPQPLVTQPYAEAPAAGVEEVEEDELIAPQSPPRPSMRGIRCAMIRSGVGTAPNIRAPIA